MDSNWFSSTFGRTRERLDVNGFAIYETVHLPLQIIPAHVHDYATMILVLHGCFEERVAGRAFRCEPGQLLFRPPLETHTNRYGPSETGCLTVAFTESRFEQIRKVSPVFDGPTWSNDKRISALAARLHSELHTIDQASALCAEGLLLELLAQTTRSPDAACNPRNAPPWLERIRESLHASFQKKIRLADVMAEAPVHPAHAVKVFRRHYGCSMGEYVRSLRVAAACRALATTEHPLAQIALDAGFCAQSHFCSIFKRITGSTPGEYRGAFLARPAGGGFRR